MESNPRLRRLESDQQAVMAAFAGHKNIKVTPLGPSPCSKYQIAYKVPALRKTDDGELEKIKLVVIEVVLPGTYPREKPYCTTTETIFHPNFGNYVCIADFWTPSNTLVDVIIQIGQMLQFQLYNTRSPLNALAARWVVENLDEIPVGSINLLPVEPEIVLGNRQK
jgi:ubiquitin-protein ligase